MRPGYGTRLHTAISKASHTMAAVMRGLHAQPTTVREYKSMITARYIQPACVLRYVMSLTQAWFAEGGENCRLRRLSAMGSVWFESVVTLNFLAVFALSPSLCIKRITRLRLSLYPRLSSSSKMRGEPYEPRPSA